MELRHLRYFLPVGEPSNFTKAAAQLRVAQPALSRQVQDLEDEIGEFYEILRTTLNGAKAKRSSETGHTGYWKTRNTL
jgi:hypothetical protein